MKYSIDAAILNMYLNAKEARDKMSPDEKKVVVKVEIQRHDGPLLIPNKLSYEKAIEALQEKAKYDNEEVVISETISSYVWDGAIALTLALEEKFGFALQQEIDMGVFGKVKPKQIMIETDLDKTVAVPWGRFSLKAIESVVDTGYEAKNGMYCFKMTATTKHKYEDVVMDLFRRVREIAAKGSIYRGKAMSIQFFDENDERIPIPTPKFLRLSDDPVIFNQMIERAIEANILTPIRYSKVARSIGASLKRGNLLAGPYGTGKTLCANMIAREAIAHGWTYFYVKEVEELPEALHLAANFQPVVVFGEDIDRVVGEERTDLVNEILNTLDGIGTKNSEMIVVLTSNHPENINPAMRREGRIDMVLEIKPPDKDSVVKLILHYGSGLIKDGEDLHEVGQSLEGQIPAMIREVVERAKLEAVRRSEGQDIRIISDDLYHCAEILKNEKKLYVKAQAEVNDVDRLGKAIGQSMGKHLVQASKEIIDRYMS